MIRPSEAVFVDTGAWIALARQRDPLHERAKDAWERLLAAGAAARVSIPVVLETFTFLERNVNIDVALTWKDSLAHVPRLKVLECTLEDTHNAWPYFKRRDLHKLSAVDATSFAVMTRLGIRKAYTFDHHFATAGFQIAG